MLRASGELDHAFAKQSGGYNNAFLGFFVVCISSVPSKLVGAHAEASIVSSLLWLLITLPRLKIAHVPPHCVITSLIAVGLMGGSFLICP